MTATDRSRTPALAVLLAGQAMASIDGSIVSVAAPTIRADLGASDAAIQLTVSCYLLTTAVLFVTCARIGDLVGHRRAFLVGLAWFTVASLVCGLAVDASMLVAARIAQAIGAALLMPQVLSLIQVGWRGQRRSRAIGLYGMVLALGVALGQVLGGLIAGVDLLGLSWRPVFLVNVPIGAAVLVVGLRHLPRDGGGGRVRLDVVGVALLTAAMTAITLPLIVGRELDWPTWAWLVLVGGIVLLAAFLMHESRTRHPVLDLAVLRPRGVGFGMLACCIVMGCYTVLLLTLTLHLQSCLGFTPLEAGIAFVPYALGFGALSLGWSSLPRRVHQMLPVVGPIANAACVLLVIVLWRDEWHVLAASAALLLAGAGHAAGYSPLIAAITDRVEPRLASAVSAMNSTGPVLAEVIAVAGIGSIYFAAVSSPQGMLDVVTSVAVLLGVASVCAGIAMRRAPRRRRSASMLANDA